MKVVVIALACIGCIYAIYSLVHFAIKVKKAGKGNCVFQTTSTQVIIHGIGITLVIMAGFIYHEEGIGSLLLFFGLASNLIIDFIDRSTVIKG